MWKDSNEDKDSLEYIVSGQLCAYPESVYIAENPSQTEQEEVKDETVVEEEPEEDHSHHHHGAHDTEEVEPDEDVQTETLPVQPAKTGGNV